MKDIHISRAKTKNYWWSKSNIIVKNGITKNNKFVR